MGKRSKHVGLAARAKKQKQESPAASNELSVELNETVDPEDEFAQLKALWNTYEKLDKETPLVLNGIIHECDRLLRNSGDKIPSFFHSVYGRALGDLAMYHTEEDESSISDYYEAAIERLENGLGKHPKNAEIHLALAQVLVNQIPLQYISQLPTDGTIPEDTDLPEFLELLGAAMASYEASLANGEPEAAQLLAYLQSYDDLLDMIDNFGQVDGKDDKDDDDENEENEESDAENEANGTELDSSHPLYPLQSSKQYTKWWRTQATSLLDGFSDNEEAKRELSRRLGDSYLRDAQEHLEIYLALTYNDEDDSDSDSNSESSTAAQKQAQKLLKKAILFLENARDPEEPETWVAIAEAKISLGNSYTLEEEQEKHYQEAEKLLIKANRVTNGQFQDILDNLKNES